MSRTSKNLPPNWKVKWQLVTKSMAAKWLGKAHSNRKLNNSVVDAYKRVMEAGLWDTRPSQSPIAIDSTGNLINGQHRLSAFAESSLDSLLFPIITGCNPDDYRLFDQDIYVRSRAAQFQGRPHVSRDMARVRALEVLTSGDPRRRIPNALYEQLADNDYSESLQWAAGVLPRTGDQMKAPFVAAFMYVHDIDPSFAENVAKPWANGGAGLPPSLLRLRDEAIRSARGTTYGAMNSSLRLLTGLMHMHKGQRVPEKLYSGINGIEYWSNLANDGVAAKWAAKG